MVYHFHVTIVIKIYAVYKQYLYSYRLKARLSINGGDRPLDAMPSLTTREPSLRLSSATAVVHSPATTRSKFVMTAVPKYIHSHMHAETHSHLHTG